MGFSKMGISGLLMPLVIWYTLVPEPPAYTIPFMFKMLFDVKTLAACCSQAMFGIYVLVYLM